MFRAKTNLNTISHNAAIDLIKGALEGGANVTQVSNLNSLSLSMLPNPAQPCPAQPCPVFQVFVDTVGPPEKYRAKLSELFPQLEITVESKADANYPVVSAASVVAKVTRDAVLRRWRFLETLPAFAGAEANRDFGCGYPSGESVREAARGLREGEG